VQLTSTEDVTGHPLSALLRAGSVAVIGASERPDSLGRQVMSQLIRGGYPGRVYPITPANSEIAGLKAWPSVLALPEPVDLTVLAVADHRLEDLFQQAIAAGTRAAAIFSPALGPGSNGESLRDRLAELAGAAGVPLCGPNGMGFVNLDHRLRICGFFQPWGLEPGPVTFLSHSGSLFSAMLHSRQRLQFNLVVSSGLESVTTMDQYLDYSTHQPTTRVVGMFVETVRRPPAMSAALRQARDRDIAVVALKVGRTERARAAAATHSEALAGDPEVYRAFFEAHGVHLVETLAEMMDTLEIFTARRRPRSGGLASVHDSGGERILLLDQAERLGVPLAAISEATKGRLAAVLDPGLEADNPVDAWSTGHNANEVFAESLRALAGDPAVGVVAFAVDLTAEETPATGYVAMLSDLDHKIEPPLLVLTNLAEGVDPVQATGLRGLGIPVLQGTETGLRAIGHVLEHVAFRFPTPLATQTPPEVAQRWRERLTRPDPILEQEALTLLRSFGIAVVPSIEASSVEEAVAAFEQLDGPVALKTAEGHLHKTEVEGVCLGLDRVDRVVGAYQDLSARLGPSVLVQEMVASGTELAMGIVGDPQFGQLLVLAAGGRLVEMVDDRVVALAPIDHQWAERMLARLRVARLLDGARGSAPADRTAVVDALVKLSDLACTLGDRLAAVDINPLWAGPSGVVAVDALAIPRTLRLSGNR
jgi:acyl-CoA synthetase (NDP forming)